MKKAIKISILTISIFLLNIYVYALSSFDTLTPANGEDISYGDNINFSWENGDYDSYKIEISIVYEITIIVYNKTISNTDLQVSSNNFEYGMRYYWRVLGIKDGKVTGISYIKSFTLR